MNDHPTDNVTLTLEEWVQLRRYCEVNDTAAMRERLKYFQNRADERAAKSSEKTKKK